LDPGDLVSADDLVQDTAMIEESPAFADRELVGETGYPAMVHVEAGAPLIQVAVRDRLHARADSGVVVAVVKNLRIGVEGIEYQPVRVQLPELNRRGVIGRVAGIRKQVDVAELRIGQIILSGGKGGRLKRRIGFTEARRKCVDVPAFRQIDAG